MQSPLFPPSLLTNNQTNEASVFIPQLPDTKPHISTSSLQCYIIPSEQNLFVQGFESFEYLNRPPTLLRGCLYLKIMKQTRIKSIVLTFKGIQRTDWPEGIPPKKNVYNESNDIITHTWPFFQSTNNYSNHNGADFYFNSGQEEANHLSVARSNTPPPNQDNFFTRNLSPSFIKRSKSPSNADSASSTFTDLTAVISPSNNTPVDNMTFQPGDYIYNFEHPVPSSIPESCNVTFGTTFYNLECNITRPGTFKSNLNGKLPINIVRTPSELNLEENESIVISRDWEDQIKYDIVIGAKSVVLNSYLPLAFRFVPLWGKVALHRIRIYITENLEYYCRNKKVHRMEPSKKYLLLEHKAQKGKSLLSEANSQDSSFEEDILPKELEFQLFVPKDLNGKSNAQIHPDTSYENIQAHHWIKICLRISKLDPENPEKRKHYEISIDSPLHVLSPLAAHNNTLLPAYDDLVSPAGPPPPPLTNDSPLSPDVTPIEHTNIRGLFNRSRSNSAESQGLSVPRTNSGDLIGARSLSPVEFHHINSIDKAIETDGDMHLEANLYKPQDEEVIININSPQAQPHPDTFINSPVQRPIHLIRQPSTNPPTFQESTKFSEPPAYEKEERVNNHLTVNSHQHSLSLSPLRIDDEAPRESTSTSNPNMLLVESNGTVRDLLIQQLKGSSQQHPSEAPVVENGDDITDLSRSPILPPSPPLRKQSRNSSISSTTSNDDVPIDLTMPLLSLSETTISQPMTQPYRNQSVTSSIYDLSYKKSLVKPVGFVDEEDIKVNLSQLRNPKLKKHYQVNEENVRSNPRQKSIGVVNDFETEEYSNEGGSMSSNEVETKRDGTNGTNELPGFKIGYIM